ncbi:PepSY domain-containing protein [Streptomyces sp. NPDC051320]|uniref:PepSY domain-containing protein n=1 Tax=Streptomyces sp. NPDC051320 TaxID=3154644 RepID=UPI003427AAC7
MLSTCGLAVAGSLLSVGAGCSGPPPDRQPEALPQVDAHYERAVSKALDEVPGSRLVSVRITDTSRPEPVWRTRVSDKDGTIHVVHVDAFDGGLLDKSVPAGQPSAQKARVAALAASAKLLPEEAVDRVKKPDFGKVTDVSLEKGPHDRTVWSVTVATIQHGETHVYQVDAMTGKVDSQTLSVPPTSEPTRSVSPPSGGPSR